LPRDRYDRELEVIVKKSGALLFRLKHKSYVVLAPNAPPLFLERVISLNSHEVKIKGRYGIAKWRRLCDLAKSGHRVLYAVRFREDEKWQCFDALVGEGRHPPEIRSSAMIIREGNGRLTLWAQMRRSLAFNIQRLVDGE